jgi:DNA-binding FadR family transcriptional regulator
MAVTDVAIAKIKQVIRSGLLTPGSRVPKEKDLAAQLGMSRNSLREAVRALTAMRILRDILADSVATDSIERFIEWDVSSHRTIAGAVGNPVLSILLDALSTHTQRVRLVRGTHLASALESDHREHESILRALEARDAQLAASAAILHVFAVEQWLHTSPELLQPT